MSGRPSADTETLTRENRELVARCENFREDVEQACTGTLRFRWGMVEAACDTCGGRCGIAVAAWVEVVDR